MKDNEAKFLGEFFALIAKYNVSFIQNDNVLNINVDDRRIATITEDKDGYAYVNVDVSME